MDTQLAFNMWSGIELLQQAYTSQHTLSGTSTASYTVSTRVTITHE